eukprot:COSAG02_NODE_1543_length_12003_cov_16.681536_10_plen_206_part_00
MYHASELQYLFGVRYPYLLGASDYTVAERVLMRGVQQMWAGVARGDTDATTMESPTIPWHTGQDDTDGALAWPVFSVDEPWLLQLEASSEAGDLSERPWAVVEASGNGSATRCSFWRHVAGYYDHDVAGVPSDGLSDGGENDGIAVQVIMLVVLLVCCVVGMSHRRKALKGGSYETLQATDTQSDHRQAPASPRKPGDKLDTASP